VASTRSLWKEFPHVDWGFKWTRSTGISWNEIHFQGDPIRTQNLLCSCVDLRFYLLVLWAVSYFVFMKSFLTRWQIFVKLGLIVIPLNSLYLSCFLRAFAKLRKATIRSIMFVCPLVFRSISISSAASGLIFMKLILEFFFLENLSRKFKFH
jgi:hypothetical protein